MERLRGITQVDSIGQWFIWISAERFCIDTIPVQAIRFLFPWYDLEHLYKPRKGQACTFPSSLPPSPFMLTNVTRCFQLGKAIYWSSFKMNRTIFSDIMIIPFSLLYPRLWTKLLYRLFSNSLEFSIINYPSLVQ